MKSNMTRAALVLGTIVLSAAAAQAAAGGPSMLRAPNGITLYVFDKDKSGVPSCYEDCAKMWPAYLAYEGQDLADGWTTVKRTGGEIQMVYKGKPVYFFNDDKKKGDKAGDDLNSVWHILNE